MFYIETYTYTKKKNAPAAGFMELDKILYSHLLGKTDQYDQHVALSRWLIAHPLSRVITSVREPLSHHFRTECVPRLRSIDIRRRHFTPYNPEYIGEMITDHILCRNHKFFDRQFIAAFIDVEDGRHVLSEIREDPDRDMFLLPPAFYTNLDFANLTATYPRVTFLRHSAGIIIPRVHGYSEFNVADFPISEYHCAYHCINKT